MKDRKRWRGAGGWCGAGMLLLVLAGCRSIQAPEKCSEQWTPDAGAPAATNGAWRAAAQAPLPEAGTLMRLPQLVDLALAQSPTLGRAWQESRAAEAQLRQSDSYYYPQLTAGGKLSWQRTDANTAQTEIDTTSYGPVAQLNWLLLDCGGRRADRESAMQQLRAKNFSFNQAFQALVLAVQQAYYNLLSARAALEAAEADLAAAEKTLEAAQKRLGAGLGVELDVLQAQADRDRTLYNRENALGQLRIAGGNLAAAIGLPADAEVQIAPPEQTEPPALAEQDLRTVLDAAMARRPDIAALRATLQARAAAVRSAQSSRWPSLNLGASANRYWHSYSGADMDDDDTFEYLGALSLDWDLFDGMLRLQKQRAAEANREAARNQLREAELSAGADVWGKFHSYQTALRKLAFSRSYLENARGAYELAAQGYAAGLKNIVDLLNSQSSLADARGGLVQTQKDVWVALAELANALGDLNFNPAVPVAAAVR